MAKQKKKRNKSYSGSNAAMSRPVVTRIQAANRNKASQYWFERKKVLKPVIITLLIIAALVVLTLEIIRIASGS